MNVFVFIFGLINSCMDTECNGKSFAVRFECRKRSKESKLPIICDFISERNKLFGFVVQFCFLTHTPYIRIICLLKFKHKHNLCRQKDL